MIQWFISCLSFSSQIFRFTRNWNTESLWSRHIKRIFKFNQHRFLSNLHLNTIHENLFIEPCASKISKIKLQHSGQSAYRSHGSNSVVTIFSDTGFDKCIVMIIFNWKNWSKSLIHLMCRVRPASIMVHSSSQLELIS